MLSQRLSVVRSFSAKENEAAFDAPPHAKNLLLCNSAYILACFL